MGTQKADLDCDEVKLSLQAVHPAATPKKIEAAGWGKKAAYVRGPSDWVAGVVPARRAARLDPVEALRYE